MDLINKKDAIQCDQEYDNGFEKQLHDMFDHIWDCEIDHPTFQDTVGELMTAVIQAFNNSAQPERKKGKWILDDDGTPAICSECGTNWINDYVDSRELYFTGKIPNYCPNCGSDNRGEQDD